MNTKKDLIYDTLECIKLMDIYSTYSDQLLTLEAMLLECTLEEELEIIELELDTIKSSLIDIDDEFQKAIELSLTSSTTTKVKVIDFE